MPVQVTSQTQAHEQTSNRLRAAQMEKDSLTVAIGLQQSEREDLIYERDNLKKQLADLVLFLASSSPTTVTHPTQEQHHQNSKQTWTDRESTLQQQLSDNESEANAGTKELEETIALLVSYMIILSFACADLSPAGSTQGPGTRDPHGTQRWGCRATEGRLGKAHGTSLEASTPFMKALMTDVQVELQQVKTELSELHDAHEVLANMKEDPNVSSQVDLALGA